MKRKTEPEQEPAPTTIIDATDLIMGRLASHAAQRLLRGENVIIINAEKAVITGNKREIIRRYKNKLQIRTASNPRRGPFQPRMPDRILRRTIRGMLPFKQAKGRDAYHRLRVYIGVPDQYKTKEAITIQEANKSRLKSRYITIGLLSRELGWHNYVYAE